MHVQYYMAQPSTSDFPTQQGPENLQVDDRREGEDSHPRRNVDTSPRDQTLQELHAEEEGEEKEERLLNL